MLALLEIRSTNKKQVEYQNGTALLSRLLVIQCSNRRTDRKHHFFTLCPVSGCTATFESNVDLESHIAANLHNVQQNPHQTANDIARLHLTELIRTTSVETQEQVRSIFHSQDKPFTDITKSTRYEKFSSVGWALRTRKRNNPVTDNVKDYMKKLWLASQQSHSRLTAEQIQQQIRTKRGENGQKLFQTHEYPTLSQIKYRLRQIALQHGVTPRDELIAELTELNIE